MKKFLILGLVSAIVVVGITAWSTQPRAADIPQVTTAVSTVKCHYPEDLNCPLTKEQEDLLEIAHPVPQDALDEMYPEKKN